MYTVWNTKSLYLRPADLGYRWDSSARHHVSVRNYDVVPVHQITVNSGVGRRPWRSSGRYVRYKFTPVRSAADFELLRAARSGVRYGSCKAPAVRFNNNSFDQRARPATWCNGVLCAVSTRAVALVTDDWSAPIRYLCVMWRVLSVPYVCLWQPL